MQTNLGYNWDNPKTYNFDEDIKNDKFEELFAKDYLGTDYIITDGYFPDYDVKDLTNDETYEIKRDYRYAETKNILVEEYYNLEEKKRGWVYYTKADYYVIFVSDTRYFVVNMKQVINDFFNRLHTWYKADIKQSQGFTTRNWVTKLRHFSFNTFVLDIHPPVSGGTQKRSV